MIQEWLEYLITEAPDWARNRGLVYESIALKARMQRQKAQWQPHLQECQAEVAQFLMKYLAADKIIVLGSGYLMEFPEGAFIDPAKSFILVDAVHPRSVQRRLRKQKNVKLLNIDLARSATHIMEELGYEISPSTVLISCNLLSQLPLSHMTGKDSAGDYRLAAQIFQRHLDFIKMAKIPCLLLSDYERCFRSPQGNVLHRESTLKGLKIPPAERNWTWTWAPKGELSIEYSAELEVGKWEFDASK